GAGPGTERGTPRGSSARSEDIWRCSVCPPVAGGRPAHRASISWPTLTASPARSPSTASSVRRERLATGRKTPAETRTTGPRSPTGQRSIERLGALASGLDLEMPSLFSRAHHLSSYRLIHCYYPTWPRSARANRDPDGATGSADSDIYLCTGLART